MLNYRFLSFCCSLTLICVLSNGCHRTLEPLAGQAPDLEFSRKLDQMRGVKRKIIYAGGEESIYVNPSFETIIEFPDEVVGGYRRKDSRLEIEKKGSYLILKPADNTIDPRGEVIIVRLKNKWSYSFRIFFESDISRVDGLVQMEDAPPPPCRGGCCA